MKRRNVIKETLAEKSLKSLTNSTKLPYEFDLIWDAKCGRDLKYIRDYKTNNELHRRLAENGFDVKEWLNQA
jgi:hypothetical protein